MRYGVTFSYNRITEDLKKARVYLEKIDEQLKQDYEVLKRAERKAQEIKKHLNKPLK